MCVLWIIGLVLLTWRLETVPPGFHGDESASSIVARDILEGEPVGVWSTAISSSPALRYHLMAGMFRIAGISVFTARLSHVLLASITLPFFYLCIRMMGPTALAVIATYLLATSDLFLAFSRRADYIPYTFSFFPMLFFFFFAQQKRAVWAYALCGLALGLSHYMYYPLWIVPGMVALIIGWYIVSERSRFIKHHGVGILALLCGYILIILPLVRYARTHPDIAFSHTSKNSIFSDSLRTHMESIMHKKATMQDIMLFNIKNTMLLFTNAPDLNAWNSLRSKPVYDPVFGAFFVLGLCVSYWHVKKPYWWQVTAFFFLFLLAGLFTNTAEIFRRVVISIYLSYIFLAVGLFASVRFMARYTGRYTPILYVVCGIAICIGGARTAYAYFTEYGVSESTKWFYATKHVAAAQFLGKLPKDTFVYYYSNSAPFEYEGIRFFAPGVKGENRVDQWGGKFSLEHTHKGQPVVYLFFPEYADHLPTVLSMYPGGIPFTQYDEKGILQFAAYRLYE